MLRAILTIDIEEWFNLPTVSAAGPEHWKQFESRIAADCERLLNALANWKAPSTWFVVGALAEKLTAQLKAAATAGHAIGCHSHLHRLCTQLSAEEFATDLRDATAVLTRAAGAAPTSFRAPMWSLHPHMTGHYEVLKKAGYTISSSWLPGRGNPARIATTGVAERPVHGWGLPGGLPIPWSGTWIMRRLGPRRLLRLVEKANAQGETPVFWFHSWELDPAPPKIPAGPLLQFVHGYRLHKLPDMFSDLSKEISWQPLT